MCYDLIVDKSLKLFLLFSTADTFPLSSLNKKQQQQQQQWRSREILNFNQVQCLRRRDVQTHHTDFGLLAGAWWADQGLQLISNSLVVIQDLSQLLDKVLGLAGVRQVPYRSGSRHSRQFIGFSFVALFPIATRTKLLSELTGDDHDFSKDSLAGCFRLKR